MNLQTMEYFLAIADEKSISKAAARLHVTQQTLSAHLAAVEDELGARLFERSVPLKITYAGEEFLKYAAAIQEQVVNLRHVFDAINGEEKGLLKIGITSNRGRIVLLPVILAFQKEHPGIELKIVEETNETLVEQLEKGQIDVAISDFASGGPGLCAVPLYRERVVFFVQKALFRLQYGEKWQEALSKIQQRGQWKLLEACPMLLGHEQDIAGKYARRLIKASGIQPVIRAESRNMGLLMQLCVEGLGGCFCPDIIARSVLTGEQQKELLAIDLGGEAEYEICIGWRRGWHVVDAFVKTARENAAGFDSENNVYYNKEKSGITV